MNIDLYLHEQDSAQRELREVARRAMTAHLKHAARPTQVPWAMYEGLTNLDAALLIVSAELRDMFAAPLSVSPRRGFVSNKLITLCDRQERERAEELAGQLLSQCRHEAGYLEKTPVSRLAQTLPEIAKGIPSQLAEAWASSSDTTA